MGGLQWSLLACGLALIVAAIALLRVKRPLAQPAAELDKAAEDALLYGTGYLRVLPSGELEHVPAGDVFLRRPR